jgi:hypothetical protein
MGKGWVICKYDGKEIPVGYRNIHLLVEHRILPPDPWLRQHNLKREDTNGILRAFKKGEKPPLDWLKQHFHQDP